MATERITETSPKTEPVLQRVISPMIPKVTNRPPLYPERWLCEVKWNGIRAIIHVMEGNETIVVRTKPQDRHAIPRNIAAQFPELRPGFSQFSQRHSLILDGEIVSGNGKSREDVVNVVRRINSSHSHVKELVSTHPCQYVAFDILYKDGKDLTSLPLDERKEILNHTIPKSFKDFGIYSNPFRRRNYQSTLTAAMMGGYEGVIFKRRDSKYRQGVESYDWLKYKFRS